MARECKQDRAMIARAEGGLAMKDYQASFEKLRTDAAEAALIRDLAMEPTKREMFDRLARHLNQLADDVEQAMAKARDQN